MKDKLLANPNSEAALVFYQLTFQSMAKKRQEFFKAYSVEDGFSFVQGRKWSTHLRKAKVMQECAYFTDAKILEAKAQNEQSTRNIITNAINIGRWIMDDVRGEERYFYEDFSKHRESMEHISGCGTECSTENDNLSNVADQL